MGPRKPPTDREIANLRRAIEEEHLRFVDVAESFGWTLYRVKNLAKRNGIVQTFHHQRSGQDHVRWFEPTPEEKESLRYLIEDEKLSWTKTAKKLGWPLRRVHRLIQRYDLKTQPSGPRPREGHPAWKGGRIVDKDGYVLIWCPDHPHKRKHTRHMLEHRLVMEKHLGRYLDPKEVVHHKNKNKQDNRIENLVLFSENSEHLRHELTGQRPKWSPEGKARILASMKQWSAIRSRNLKRGAARKPGKTRRSRA